MSIRQCRRAVINLDKIVNPKHNLKLRDFKPKTDFNIELLVGVSEFRNITCVTPFVTRSFELPNSKSTRWAAMVIGSWTRIRSKTCRSCSSFVRYSFFFNVIQLSCFFFFIFFPSSSSAYIYIDDAWSTNEALCGRFVCAGWVEAKWRL